MTTPTLSAAFAPVSPWRTSLLVADPAADPAPQRVDREPAAFLTGDRGSKFDLAMTGMFALAGAVMFAASMVSILAGDWLPAVAALALAGVAGGGISVLWADHGEADGDVRDVTWVGHEAGALLPQPARRVGRSVGAPPARPIQPAGSTAPRR